MPDWVWFVLGLLTGEIIRLVGYGLYRLGSVEEEREERV